MNVKDPELVIVRGINSDWMDENFTRLKIFFGGSWRATPKEDAYYVGLYLESPKSVITHIGIVDNIERLKNMAIFNLKAIIRLKEPIDRGHAIRAHENWELSDFGLTKTQMERIREQLNVI